MASKDTNGSVGNGDAFDDIPEPDYDHLAASFLEEDEDSSDDSLGKSKTKKSGKTKALDASLADPPYILGTLIVRVVAARDLEPAHNQHNFGDFLFGGGKGKSGTANPYASVKFGSSAQRTSALYDTLDPVWPRGETMFMDVSLPLSKITHPDDTIQGTTTISNNDHYLSTENDETNNWNDDSGNTSLFYTEREDRDGMPLPDIRSSTNASSNSSTPTNPRANHKDNVDFLDVPRPTLTVAIFSSEMAKSLIPDNSKYPNKNQPSGDSDDDFLGMASVDLTQLLTGKKALVDTWLPLAGAGRGSVRLVCEYEASDVAPSPGDYVRFTRFCHPADLHPLVPGKSYPVQEVLDNDQLLLSYTTPEGWVCSFVIHRFMVICTDRHHNAVTMARNEWEAFTDRFSHSPLMGTVTETVERLPDEGLFSVGANALQGGASLLGRWLEGGLETAVKDVTYATNWDGHFTAENRVQRPTNQPAYLTDNRNATTDIADDIPSSEAECAEKKPSPLSLKPEPVSSQIPLPNMPSCPITGEPMIDPVVAADGHTYERSAIARWLQESDKSPLTGSVLPHKELVPNYGLLSSLQEQADKIMKKSAPDSNVAVSLAGGKYKDDEPEDVLDDDAKDDADREARNDQTKI